MNPALSKFMLKSTPKSILNPEPDMNTAIPLNNGSSIPALGLGTWYEAPMYELHVRHTLTPYTVV
jgi:glycerol 2-dehydrogenase (NADP+)